MSNEIQRWADASMFEAEPFEEPEIRVYLMWMTPDPLAAIAAASMLYEGKVIRNLSEVTWEQKQHYMEAMEKTHLTAPLEFVKFHFLFEGVSRSLTHQIVRQRTAAYVQESLRFAVIDDLPKDAVLPPSLAELPPHHDLRQRWDAHMQATSELYNYFIANNIPGEDAREILPHATRTRMHYTTDLRNLADHAGNRLCTQAQFFWRDLWDKILTAIHDHSAEGADLLEYPLFKPKCYQLGHCPFKADFDRGCTIRKRVDQFAAAGVPSRFWGGEPDEAGFVPDASITPIEDREWKFDRKAAFQ